MVGLSDETSENKNEGKVKSYFVAFVFCPQTRVSGAQTCTEILTLGPLAWTRNKYTRYLPGSTTYVRQLLTLLTSWT